MPVKTHADRVREFARTEYIEPARTRHESVVHIVAGHIQETLCISNRVSLVCQALRSSKFLDGNHLVLERWEGPPSGKSTTSRVAVYGAAGNREGCFTSLGGGEVLI